MVWPARARSTRSRAGTCPAFLLDGDRPLLFPAEERHERFAQYRAIGERVRAGRSVVVGGQEGAAGAEPGRTKADGGRTAQFKRLCPGCPLRERERARKGFRPTGAAQRFLSAFSGISPHFRPRRHLMTAAHYRTGTTIRFALWGQITDTAGRPTTA